MTDVQVATEAEVQTTDAEPHTCGEPGRTGASSTRRCVLLGAGALGATAVLAACGTSTTASSNDTGSDFSNTPAPAGSGPANAGGTGNGGGSTSGGGTTIATTADVKVGAGVIKGSYVVTQPEAGTYKAFSTLCPHAGCNVNKVDGGVISCPCHGSQFSIKDGSVTQGPATTGLTEKSVKVDGSNIVAA